MPACGGQTFKQAVATAIVCFLYATSVTAEVCDKGGWDPANGPVTFAGTIVANAAWSLGATVLLFLGIVKRWHWLVWPTVLFSAGMVIVGVSDNPEDPFVQSMIIEGCRIGSQGMIMSISFAIPLIIGAVVATVKQKLKSGTQ